MISVYEYIWIYIYTLDFLILCIFKYFLKYIIPFDTIMRNASTSLMPWCLGTCLQSCDRKICSSFSAVRVKAVVWYLHKWDVYGIKRIGMIYIYIKICATCNTGIWGTICCIYFEVILPWWAMRLEHPGMFLIPVGDVFMCINFPFANILKSSCLGEWCT